MSFLEKVHNLIRDGLRQALTAKRFTRSITLPCFISRSVPGNAEVLGEFPSVERALTVPNNRPRFISTSEPGAFHGSDKMS